MTRSYQSQVEVDLTCDACGRTWKAKFENPMLANQADDLCLVCQEDYKKWKAEKRKASYKPELDVGTKPDIK
jgi:hypothetical protein